MNNVNDLPSKDNVNDLLIEIGTEELPPKALLKLSQSFEKSVADDLKEAGLEHTGIKAFAAPRRLALLVTELAEKQADREINKRGPALTAAFGDDGCPTKAAEGFARSCGVESVDQLSQLKTDKGAWLAYTLHEKGLTAAELIPDIVRKALDKLPIPKRMRWGAGDAQFVRPVHWVVLLLGNTIIDTEILSIKSDNKTFGHRFHHPAAMTLFDPASYEDLLKSQGYVIADFAKRRDIIKQAVIDIATKENGTAVIDDALLDEVTAMVEWPVAVLGNFDESFLDVPMECLISSMKGHQKYFHMLNSDGKLMPNFITVSNIDSSNPDTVRKGNERVIRPRLSDAEFFWQQDKKHRLDAHQESLKKVVFQKKLGSVHDKSERIAALAKTITDTLGEDSTAAIRAAQLCKCDLMSEMVNEFPDLQGVMGRYYASADGEADNIAQAIEDHYRPRFAGDDLPKDIIGQAISIADKLDTLVGLYAIGQPPTGQKDPYALRRAALGILRICMECSLNINVHDLIASAANNYKTLAPKLDVPDNVVDDVFDFILGRLAVYYSNQDFAGDEIDAIVSLRPGQFNELDQRLRAVAAFRKLPEAESLSAANTRITNILKKSKQAIAGRVDSNLLNETAEIDLHNAIQESINTVEPLLADDDYTTALTQLANLKDPVDAFFDNVMVMADDEAIRNNRLALLNILRQLFLRIADLSRLQN